MKVSVAEDYSLVLEEVFNSVVFRTEEGNELVVCMRDGGFEIATRDTTCKSTDGCRYFTWYQANGSGIKPMCCAAGSEKTESGEQS